MIFWTNWRSACPEAPARTYLRTLAILWLALLLALPEAASAEGFSFTVNRPAEAAPASVFDLPCARALAALPALTADWSGDTLRLTLDVDLPAGAETRLAGPDGAALSAAFEGRSMTVRPAPASGWLRLGWTEGGTAVSARYLVRDGEPCTLWEAAATADGVKVSLDGQGGYHLPLQLDRVAVTDLYYGPDGWLMSSVLLGDTREADTLPLTVQYDGFGRAESVTAADLMDTYTYNRALGAWLDDQGNSVTLDRLPAFDIGRHPAPAARPLTYGTLYLKEGKAGVDRAALLASAPALTSLAIGSGVVTFESDAPQVRLTVDNAWVYDTRQGSLLREGNTYGVAAAYIDEESFVTVTLTRGTVTAVYEGEKLVSVTDSAAGVRWTANGEVRLTNGAATVTYDANGALKQVLVASADGATLTYNAAGNLTGWSLDGYSWSRKHNDWTKDVITQKGEISQLAIPPLANIKPLDRYPPALALQ